MVTSEFSSLFSKSYAQGAPVSTAGKPLFDGNIDVKSPSFPKKLREEINYFNLNETDVQAMVMSITSKTMGISINVQVESKSNKFNKEAEEFIERHSQIGVGELTGQHTFNSGMRTLSDFEVLHGGIIVRHHYSQEWYIPYKYELVGVDMIDYSITKHSYMSKDKTSTINGIVRDRWGVITHLYLYTTEDKTLSEKVSYKNLTYFSKKWVSVDQQVAISKLSSMLGKLDSTGQYETAELESALEEAKAGHYIKSSAYNEVMKLVSEAIQKEVGSTSGAKAIAKSMDMVKPVLKELANLGVTQRGLTPIPSEDEIAFNTSKRDGIYNDLTSNSEMKTSASMGMSDIAIYSKASEANYSSIKYIMEVDKMSSGIRFDDISKIIINEILTRLVRVGIQTGFISERTAYWKDPFVFNKFRYLRQNDLSIEPAKTAIANEKNIQLGLDTKADIVERTKGIKYENFLTKMYEQEIFAIKLKEEMYKKAGIEIQEEEKKTQKIKVKKSKQTTARLEILAREEDIR